jgi:RNA 2',3'-cyclic 3'-phosphodiesterase
VLKNFEELLEEIQPLARIRWSPVSELHITTKFIGAWPFSRVPELCRYLHELPKLPKFPLTLTGLRYFPGPNRSWVLYAKVEPSEPLNRLAVDMDFNLAHYSIQRERREYLPHVTIGRVMGSNPWLELDERVELYSEKPLGTFEVNEYHLYESTPSGYRQCSTIPLL